MTNHSAFLLNRCVRNIAAIILLGALLAACVQTGPSRQTDLSIAAYTPAPDALAIAEKEAKAYWAKHQGEMGAGTRYLAVESDTIPSADIPDLYYRLTSSPGVNGSDVEKYRVNDDIDIFCINIFDTRTGKLVSPQGYAVVDEPDTGSIARFGSYLARFVGTGD
ncbi:MAG TPA: hypothetical protein VFO40_13085 [Chthoniobacterales bacterium]|nr:hypothetical protein [Chthoniobacterales bacterium]